MLVSSANKIILNNYDTSHMSFMYKINSTGPRIDPCGTPHLIFFSSVDSLGSNLGKSCYLLVKKELYLHRA